MGKTRIKLKIRDRDKGYKAFYQTLEDDDNFSHAAVGIIGGGEELKKAVANEFGTKNIPERPFIRQTFDNNIKELKKLAKTLSIHVIDGKLTKRQALDRLGDVFKAKIFEAIRNREFQDNAASTIKKKNRTAKKRKGESRAAFAERIASPKSVLPLVDTGRMQQSIKVEVRP